VKALAAILALSLSLPAFAERPVYVLDGAGRSVARLDVQRGTIEAKAALPFLDAPAEMVAAPDGKRLIVLAPGKNRDSNASAAIVDTATLIASPRIDLGRGVADVVFARDGKSAIVLSPGHAEVPGALVRIDLATEAITRRLTLDRVVDQFGAVSDDTGVVFQKGGKYGNARVTFVALPALEVIGSVDLTGKAAELVHLPGSGYLYALESNAVDVLSIADRKLAGTVSIGNNARLGGIDEATGSLFVTGSNDQKNGMLYVLRGAALVGTSAAGSGVPEMFRLSADGKRAFVGNVRGVTEVSLAELNSLPPAPIYSGFMASSMTTIDSAATPDGSRVLLLMRQYDKCCTLAITDPAGGRKVATMQAGRKSRRVAQALFAVAATAASFSAGRADAKANGRGSFYYSIYSPAAARNPRGAFAFGSDGKTAYVLDSGTDTVTAVDAESGKRIADLDAPDDVREILALGDRTIIATGDKGLALIDSALNVVAETVDLEGELHGLVVLPDGATALALSQGELTVIDGRAGRVGARIGGLDPIAVVW
jgi:DNA-binding beta-propeller fold protein YncE